MKIERFKDLKDFNSFKISVKANYFIELTSTDNFYSFFKIKNELPKPWYILGGGNNSLFINDFKGSIIKISNQGINVLNENNEDITLEIQAGVDWNYLVDMCISKGYYGLENLIDIPGQVGSAPIQNIGAYGAEVKNVIQSVNYFDLNDGKFINFSNSDCHFEYRSSIFKNELNGKGIINSVIMKLGKSKKLNYDYGTIKQSLQEQGITNPTQKQLAETISNIRSSKLPDPKIIGNAGSFFKNPVIDLSGYNRLKEKYPEAVAFKLPGEMYKIAAGWMIDKAGWKGKEMGNVAVHPKQALVLINKTGFAQGKEVKELAQRIINDVLNKFDIKLEAEVNIIY